MAYRKINYTPETLARRKEYQREYAAARRRSPEGAAGKVIYMREYRKRYRESPEGREKLRENNRRWKKSEKGKKANREFANKKYVKRAPRVRLSPEEAARRKKASYIKTASRPEYVEKRRVTSWKRYLKITYGLTPEEHSTMAINGCQICGEPDAKDARLCVDHCHATGKIRGLLCSPCNTGLGFFRDNTLKLENAVLYLKRAQGA